MPCLAAAAVPGIAIAALRDVWTPFAATGATTGAALGPALAIKVEGWRQASARLWAVELLDTWLAPTQPH